MTPSERTILAILAVLLAALVGYHFVGCSPVARSITPISSSHSQLTATEYDLAETEFSGGLAAMPVELQAAADAECQRLLERRDLAAAFVLGFGTATGASGIGTLIPKETTPDERKRWDVSLGALTLGFAITGTILGALVHSWSSEFERECVQETPAPREHSTSDEVEVDAGT